MDNNQRNSGPGGNNNNGSGGPNNQKNHSTIMIFLVVTLVTLVIMSLFNNMMQDSTSQEITYDQFLEMVDEGQVERVIFGDNTLTIVPKIQPFSDSGVEISYYTG